MKYKTLHAISIRGTRIERGQIVDIDSDLAKSLDTRDIVELGKATPDTLPTKAVEIPVDVEKLKKDDLVELCKKLGLSSEGKKSDLIERIQLSKIKV
jgi:hypothetical protein